MEFEPIETAPQSDKRHEPKMEARDSVYISLIHAKAENYSLALNLDGPSAFRSNLVARRKELDALLSPNIVIELCNAWKKLQQLQKELEEAELEEMEG